jgi:hypothetical protein
LGVSTLLASVKQGFPILGLFQPLPHVGEEAVGVGPSVV